VRGVIGFGLVAIMGGVVGLVVAALLGAETRVSVSGGAVETYHGARPVVLVAGAALGMVLGGLAAWSLDPLARRGDCGARLTTEPGAPRDDGV
jgi:hypothetical protein